MGRSANHRLKIVFYSVWAIGLILLFQNCNRSEVRYAAESQKRSGNGEGYDFKLDGTYESRLPDFTCENHPAPEATLEIHQDQVQLTINQPDKCEKVKKILSKEELKTSPYQSFILGHGERVFESSQALKDTESVDTWCFGQLEDNRGVDLNIKHNEETGTYRARIFDALSQTVAFSQVNKGEQQEEIQFSSELFSININREKYNEQGYLDGSLYLHNSEQKTKHLFCLRNDLRVQPAYHAAENWNSYVRRTDPSVACDGSEQTPNACVHGGKRRKVITSVKSCAGLQLKDELGFFDWTCNDQSGLAIFSSQLRPNIYLSHLLSGNGFKPNSVRLTNSTDKIVAKSTPTAWWRNEVHSLAPSSSVLTIDGKDDDSEGPDQAYQPGAIFYFDQDTNSAGLKIHLDGVSIVTREGASLRSSTSSQTPLIEIEGASFISLEGHFDGAFQTGPYLIKTFQTNWLRIENALIENGNSDGHSTAGNIYLKKSNHVVLSQVDSRNSKGSGLTIYKDNSNITIENSLFSNNANLGASLSNIDGLFMKDVQFKNNNQEGLLLREIENGRVSSLTSLSNGDTGIRVFSSRNSSLVNLASQDNGSSNFTVTKSNNLFVAGLNSQKGRRDGIRIAETESSFFYNLLSHGSQYYGLQAQGDNVLSRISVSNSGYIGAYLKTGTVAVDLSSVASSKKAVLQQDDTLQLFSTYTSGQLKADQVCPSEMAKKTLISSLTNEVYLAYAVEIIDDSVGDNDGRCESFERCLALTSDHPADGLLDKPVRKACILKEGTLQGIELFVEP